LQPCWIARKPSCRQTFSRARRHVQAHRPRFDTSPEIHERLVTGFINALQTGDLNNLTTLLAADAILHSDGGGKVPAAVHPIVGRERILAFMAGLAHQALKIGLDYRLEAVRLNGELGLVGRDAVTGEVFLAATFEVFGEQITTLRYVRNPDKLVRLASS
jgi:RNA polymerase sigma-70 factor (ECF subfamily)